MPAHDVFFHKYAVALTFLRALNDIRVAFLRLGDKCKIINVKRNAKHLSYKYHWLFGSFLSVA